MPGIAGVVSGGPIDPLVIGIAMGDQPLSSEGLDHHLAEWAAALPDGLRG
jgi:hypothetical protein